MVLLCTIWPKHFAKLCDIYLFVYELSLRTRTFSKIETSRTNICGIVKPLYGHPSKFLGIVVFSKTKFFLNVGSLLLIFWDLGTSPTTVPNVFQYSWKRWYFILFPIKHWPQWWCFQTVQGRSVGSCCESGHETWNLCQHWANALFYQQTFYSQRHGILYRREQTEIQICRWEFYYWTRQYDQS